MRFDQTRRPGFDVEMLERLVAEGWLRRRRHPDADIWIYNYSEKCQFEHHWTPETLACRGLILDAEGRVVARPFPKFFNYGDPQVGRLPIGPFIVTEKIDGSLGILYRLDGEAFIATRGSFTSGQAREGTAMLADYEFEARGCDTPLFEIVYPSNRIVVDYGERRELVLLAVIDNLTGGESAMDWSGPVVERHAEPSLSALLDKQRPNREGYVVLFESGLRVKIKHKEYERLHRIVTEVNARHIWEALRAGQDPTAELDGVPDEIFEWVRQVTIDLRGRYRAEEAAARHVFDRRPDGDRAEVARYFKESGANTAVLFLMLDDKDHSDLIWRAIRPGPMTPDTAPTEP